MIRPIRHVIFDLGGVLVGLDQPRCQAAFRAIGLPEVAELIDPCHPNAMMQQLEHGEIDFAEACQAMRRLSNNPTVTDEAIAEAFAAFLLPIPVEKLRLIEGLRQRGVHTYVLSNNNPVSMAVIARMFTADGRTMEDYFDRLYLSYQMRMLKPSEEIFRAMLEDSGMVAEECLFIDDSARNIATARTLGMQVWQPQVDDDFAPILNAIGSASPLQK